MVRLFVILLCCSLFSDEVRAPSYPYISGDGFRAYCDFIIDETGDTLKSFDPRNVREGNTIFLKRDYLDYFFTHFHPQIQHRYILVTHNGANPVPDGFGIYLDDPKLIAWFGQNVDEYNHEKLHPIPVGIANSRWPHGNVQVINEARERSKKLPRSNWLYLNFETWTCEREREPLYEKFRSAPYCKRADRVGFKDYLLDLAQSRFVLSPRGYGVDTHRTWEALLMGAIPIIKTSWLDPVYHDLPVVIVKDWDEISFEFLELKWKEMKRRKYNTQKLYAKYWLDLISFYKSES